FFCNQIVQEQLPAFAAGGRLSAVAGASHRPLMAWRTSYQELNNVDYPLKVGAKIPVVICVLRTVQTAGTVSTGVKRGLWL
ncbi:MAG: hypothetical protein IKY91_09515, partial [Akkermansia sp.]|nr:hypothetical protein [Akkermansia sp.]